MDSGVLSADIRELEAKYRAVLEVTGDGLIIHTLDGVIVEANSAFCAMNGYTQEELLGLGGTLEVESALGTGTCICVRIARR